MEPYAVHGNSARTVSLAGMVGWHGCAAPFPRIAGVDFEHVFMLSGGDAAVDECAVLFCVVATHVLGMVIIAEHRRRRRYHGYRSFERCRRAHVVSVGDRWPGIFSWPCTGAGAVGISSGATAVQALPCRALVGMKCLPPACEACHRQPSSTHPEGGTTADTSSLSPPQGHVVERRAHSRDSSPQAKSYKTSARCEQT